MPNLFYMGIILIVIATLIWGVPAFNFNDDPFDDTPYNFWDWRTIFAAMLGFFGLALIVFFFIQK